MEPALRAGCWTRERETGAERRFHLRAMPGCRAGSPLPRHDRGTAIEPSRIHAKSPRCEEGRGARGMLSLASCSLLRFASRTFLYPGPRAGVFRR